MVDEKDLNAPVLILAQTLTEKFASPEYIPGCKITDITDIDEYTTDNGWIEAFCGQHNNQRVRYRGFPAGVVADDFIDVMHFPDRKTFEVQGNGGTATTGLDAVKVSRIWESDGGTIALRADATGKIGIGTDTIPHGGVGGAMLALDGPDSSSATGPLIQITTDTDDYPLLTIRPFTHDDVSLAFDAYLGAGAWRSSDAGSNFRISKITDRLLFSAESGIAQASPVTWVTAISIDPAAFVGINTNDPATELDVAGDITLLGDIIHDSDPDTKIGFGLDSFTVTTGALELLKLTETTQNLVEIGDTAGGGDVDVDINNGQMFLQGSDGSVGIGLAAPTSAGLHIRKAISTVYADVTPSIGNTLVAISNTQVAESTDDQAQLQFNVNGGTHNRIGSVGLVAENSGTRLASLVFCTDNGSTRTEKMRITGAGLIGIGAVVPTARLTVNDGSSATLTDFTQALANAGVHIENNYTADNYTPGVFWGTDNNNPTKPKGGIWLRETSIGSYMYFGTSNAYVTGITNNGLVMDPSGNIGIGTNVPGSLMEWNFATEDLEFVDAGSTSATEQDWIEVQVAGNTGYVRVYATK